MKKIRSKHNNLLNYFIHDRRDLSPAYARSCEKFFRELGKKNKVTSSRVGPPNKVKGSKLQG